MLCNKIITTVFFTHYPNGMPSILSYIADSRPPVSHGKLVGHTSGWLRAISWSSINSQRSNDMRSLAQVCLTCPSSRDCCILNAFATTGRADKNLPSPPYSPVLSHIAGLIRGTVCQIGTDPVVEGECEWSLPKAENWALGGQVHCGVPA